MKVGFTGTRHGMDTAQRAVVSAVLFQIFDQNKTPNEFECHHGDCVGADAEFHAISSAYDAVLVGHPGPVNDRHRAFCKFDETRAPLTHMKRNRAIVDAVDVVIAAPFDLVEQQYGGTWATIRMARKAKKRLAIVLRSGVVTYENWSVS